jgi:hypothetical protein
MTRHPFGFLYQKRDMELLPSIIPGKVALKAA